jgi:hypothetical protein
VEPTLALTSRHPDRQQPDADSFVADNSGNAEFDGRVAGPLLDAQRLQIAVIYHFDGKTYGPVANAAEANGPSQATADCASRAPESTPWPARDHPEVTPTDARAANAGERVTDPGPGRLISSLSGGSAARHRAIAQRPASESNPRRTTIPRQGRTLQARANQVARR